jgi:predicted TIM-barrel fold metal-dependent hydrolase
MERTLGSSDNYLLVSSDCHAGAPPSVYAEYLEADARQEYHEWLQARTTRPQGAPPREADTITQQIGGLALDPFGPSIRHHFYTSEPVQRGGVEASWDPDRRVSQLNAAGVAAEVVFPDSQHRNGPPFADVRPSADSASPVLQRAGRVAHNRWLADLCSASPQRHAGVILVDFDDIDVALADMATARDAGLSGGILLPPLALSTHDPSAFWNHRRYEPVWDACEDLDLPVNIHVAGAGANYGDHFSTRWINSMELFWITRRPVWLFLWSGVLERHPTLKVVITEAGGAWAPEMLETMEYLYDNRNPEAAHEFLPHRPREYWSRQCFIGASPPAGRPEIVARDQIGVTNLMWGNDYPHVEGTWTAHASNSALALVEDVPDGDARLFLGMNAATVYGFDQKALQAIASEIGPSPTSADRLAIPLTQRLNKSKGEEEERDGSARSSRTGREHPTP